MNTCIYLFRLAVVVAIVAELGFAEIAVAHGFIWWLMVGSAVLGYLAFVAFVRLKLRQPAM